MRNRINICVFDDFFADCMTNAIISMTLFYDESYRLAAYMNGYEPHFGPYPDQYFPYIGYSEGYKHIFERCFEYQGLLYEDDDYLKLVKKSINEGKYLQLGVDLFYWHDTGAAYQKEHLAHPSLIVGYDDALSTLYVLEDALGSRVTYGICEIPYERLKQAIDSKENNFRELTGEDYRLRRRKMEVPSFSLDFEEVKQNARSILQNLSDDRFTNFSMHGDEYADRLVPTEYIKVHTRYENRCIANKLLCKELLQRGFISQAQCDAMTECSQNMLEDIGQVKYILMRQQKTGRPLKLELIEKLWSNVIQTEKEMWKSIV